MGSIDKVKVAVRVRPFNRREIDLGAKCVVDMEKDQTILFHPSVAFNKDRGCLGALAPVHLPNPPLCLLTGSPVTNIKLVWAMILVLL
ncbi:hypothetical protein LSAT2_032241 [Lamellibrachia satsuma]|nr:hypothetical protein LSAT2_032241 [Lamellibrachia satsuma]